MVATARTVDPPPVIRVRHSLLFSSYRPYVEHDRQSSKGFRAEGEEIGDL